MNEVQNFITPGQFSYTAPAEANRLLVEVAGSAGGPGGMDDASGGNGAGGTIVTATIVIQGGETINITVAEGGEGAFGQSGEPRKIAFGIGAAGGGDGTRQTPNSLSSAIPGAGGKGGNQGNTGSSPGGAGGGGASALFIAGAAVIAGGGGGGGSNSTIFRDGTWNVRADDAVNQTLFSPEDRLCTATANGQQGQSATETTNRPLVDGSGGSGGGGGYPNNAGQGGQGGLDGRSGQHGEPGGSGGSCTLSTGIYRISDIKISAGPPTIALPTKDDSQPDGQDGFVRITPTFVQTPDPITPTPVPTLGALGLLALSSAIGAAGIGMVRRVKLRKNARRTAPSALNL